VIRAAVYLERPGFTLDVAFETQARVTGVFGPSGAGKTTLINMIAGLDRPDRGAITINGRDLYDSARRIDVPAHHRRIGVVFQEHRLFPHYSVRGNLRYGAQGNRGGFDRIVELLELGSLLQRRVHDLSGGERQRVAIGRALLSDPQAILLDEPLASLDMRLRQQIIPYFRRLRESLRAPMLYISHDLSEILQMTDDLLVLDRGRVAAMGQYTEILHDDAVLRLVHDRGMTNVVNAIVRSHVRADGITMLDIARGSTDRQAAQQIAAPLIDASIGSVVTARIQPWDIALAAEPVRGVSIQNQLRGTVSRCSVHHRMMLVEVNLGAPLIAEISLRSAGALNVRAGAEVVLLIKSHAIRYLDQPAPDAVEALGGAQT